MFAVYMLMAVVVAVLGYARDMKNDPLNAEVA